MTTRNSPVVWYYLCLCLNCSGTFFTDSPTRNNSATAGFNQTDRALAVYLQQQSGSQESIWTLGERSRRIWIAADITFQTTKPAKVRGQEVEISHQAGLTMNRRNQSKGKNKPRGKKEGRKYKGDK